MPLTSFAPNQQAKSSEVNANFEYLNGLIENLQSDFDRGQKTVVSNTDGATITFDLSENSVHTVTLGGNRILALAGATTGQVFIINLLQDGSGSKTVTWFSGIKWPDGVAPTLSTGANKYDSFGFICIGSGSYLGFIIGQNLS